MISISNRLSDLHLQAGLQEVPPRVPTGSGWSVNSIIGAQYARGIPAKNARRRASLRFIRVDCRVFIADRGGGPRPDVARTYRVTNYYDFA
jgi:hypothetical protein